MGVLLGHAMVDSLEAGLVWACVGLGVYLTFRILAFPDLTVEGSFPAGAAIAAAVIFRDGNPIAGTLLAAVGGAIAGAMTGLLHTRRKINDILSGILVATGLYSLNILVMDRPNTPLLGKTTVYEMVAGLMGAKPGVWPRIALLLLISAGLALVLNWFLHTDIGLAIRATGSNPGMAESMAIRTENLKILGLMIANGLVALSGALTAQLQGFADIGMGVGTLVVGFAAVIIAEAVFGVNRMVWNLLALLAGSFIYRLIVAIALLLGLPATQLKLVAAFLVVLTLGVSLPKIRARLADMLRQAPPESSAPIGEHRGAATTVRSTDRGRPSGDAGR